MFDIQVERTENFIANGLVSHNTRWHVDDLAGRILDSPDAVNWVVVNLPALAEPADPLGRPMGSALCPDRYDEEALASIRSVQGERSFTALFQQRPVPDSGGMFRREWFPIVDAPPAPANLVGSVRSWDMAASVNGDYTVGARMSRGRDGLFYVDDIVRGRWTPHERDAVILQTAQADGRAVPVVLEQEPGSAGVSVVAQMVRMLAGYAVTGERSTGDKSTRAAPFASQCQAGNVRLVRGDWCREWLDELALFPHAKHDDQVDATAAAFNRLALPEPSHALATAPRPFRSWRGTPARR